MNSQELKSIIEALLFVSEKPLSLDKIKEVLEDGDKKDLKNVVNELIEDYQKRDSGLQITEIAGGYQICTRAGYSPWIKKMNISKFKIRLSPAALETLAIIAYKQPVIRAEIESIRGVDAGGVLKTLLEKKLIKILGRRQTVGKPIVYGTTIEFMQHFGLKNLSDLPVLSEIMEMK